MYSNSRNDVPRVAQRYGTIAAHYRRRASVLVVFVAFCMHMHSFAGLIRRTPPPTFSDTAITDRHPDTTIFQLRAHWVRLSWSIGCRFDKADATADVQWHCNYRPPPWYHYFPAQSSLGAVILVYWIGKIVRTCAPGGSRTLDFLHARRAPYPLSQALRFFQCNRSIEDVCVCIPILVTTFPEWLGGTEPLPHSPGAVRPSSLCL